MRGQVGALGPGVKVLVGVVFRLAAVGYPAVRYGIKASRPAALARSNVLSTAFAVMVSVDIAYS